MTTEPTGWRRIRGILEAAIDVAPAERTAFLDAACGGDADLRRELGALLARDSPAAQDPPSPGAGWFDSPADPAPPAVGRRVGAYVLVREIGSGGMGTVYLAERDDGAFRRRVAVKLIRRGMDTEDILRRFRNERQVLAGLEHPNIARLLDGGATEDGLPYLAMEYVDGVPIDRWCEQNRPSLERRLELFLGVCSAVQHAHQNLVVHRDLKPSNILVTPAGEPKLLDFGIAKVLGPEGGERTLDRTLTGKRLLTPGYASPEQLSGSALTTASDVFSLGVLLYELLVGESPFGADRRAAPAGSERTERPSTRVRARGGPNARARAKRLAGDLDTIVLTALRSEPSRRYASVDRLAADVRRHLDGMPVLARPDSLGYRASRFVRRNRLIVGATVALLLALAAGLGATTVLYLQAERARRAERAERQVAERRFDNVRSLATRFIFDVHAAIEPLQGSLPARHLIVQTATDYLERLAHERRDDPELQLQLAQSWLRIGEIQCSRAQASFGNTEAALRCYGKTVEIARGLLRDDPSSATRGLLLVQGEIRVVEMLLALKRLPEAQSACAEVLRLDEALAAAHPESRGFERARIRDHSRMAEILRSLGDSAGALDEYRTAAAEGEALARAWPGDDDVLGTVGTSLERIGEILGEDLRSEEALALEHRALGIFLGVSARDPERAAWRREIAVCRNLEARIESLEGCDDEACEDSLASLGILLTLWSGDARNSAALADAGTALGQHAGLLLAAERPAEAIAYGRESLSLLEELVHRDPENLEARRNFAMAGGYLAVALVRTGSPAEGLREFDGARLEMEAIAAVEPSDATLRTEAHLAEARIGAACLSAADAPDLDAARRLDLLRRACDEIERGLQGLERLHGEGRAPRVSEASLRRFGEELARGRGRLAASEDASR
jgi:serine/threonine protein kinase/tetratricopeptide (TPR) repeat protein